MDGKNNIDVIEFTFDQEKRFVDISEVNLEYWIHESNYPNEYKEEIINTLFIIGKFGYTNFTTDWLNWFLKAVYTVYFDYNEITRDEYDEIKADALKTLEGLYNPDELNIKDDDAENSADE